MIYNRNFVNRCFVPIKAYYERVLSTVCKQIKVRKNAYNYSSCKEVGDVHLFLSHSVRTAFTLTEILLAIAIVGIIAALILPALVSNYQNRALNIGFEREIKTLTGAVQNLAVSENKVNFYSTVMYTITEPVTYDNTSGKFVKKYMKVSKYCGNSNGDCFADKYYNYNESTHKKEVYVPAFKGACASLKNGASICITPQVGSQKISGLIDINGKKGPNVFGRDLRHFIIDSSAERSRFSRETTEVISAPESDLKLNDVCAENSLSKECCDTKSITSKTDPCCIHYKGVVGHACYEEPIGDDCSHVKVSVTYSCRVEPSTYIVKCTVNTVPEPKTCRATTSISLQHGIINGIDFGFENSLAKVYAPAKSSQGYEGEFTYSGFNLQSEAEKKGVTLSNCNIYGDCLATFMREDGTKGSKYVHFMARDAFSSITGDVQAGASCSESKYLVGDNYLQHGDLSGSYSCDLYSGH